MRLQQLSDEAEFQLTTSRRGRLTSFMSSHKSKRSFQLTTSRRGRRFLERTYFFKRNHFNSRPHEEVDLRLLSEVEEMKTISTHDLTKRSTKLSMQSHNMLHISTHDLTKRSTNTHDVYLKASNYFNSRPHEEVDKSPILKKLSWTIFQLTTSRRGRLVAQQKSVTPAAFQLTTSRRGRLQFHTTLRHLKLSFLCLYYIFEHFLLY